MWDRMIHERKCAWTKREFASLSVYVHRRLYMPFHFLTCSWHNESKKPSPDLWSNGNGLLICPHGNSVMKPKNGKPESASWHFWWHNSLWKISSSLWWSSFWKRTWTGFDLHDNIKHPYHDNDGKAHISGHGKNVYSIVAQSIRRMRRQFRRNWTKGVWGKHPPTSIVRGMHDTRIACYR